MITLKQRQGRQGFRSSRSCNRTTNHIEVRSIASTGRFFEESSWQDGFDFNRFGFELRRARIQQAGTVSHSGTIPLVDRRSRPMVTLANACSVAA